ncbi:MAG: 3-hydroxyacyl-CoA dehydrogenase NAD-binding domain-containing protein [Saprospiraceae bacterium]
MIRYTKDTDQIAIITLDMKGRPLNILNHEIVDAFVPVIEHLKKEKSLGRLKGVIITSAKKTFLAGGDLEYLSKSNDPRKVFDFSQKLKAFFRDLERPGVPVVAAINGSAFGTGFELALACHRRIVLDKMDVRIGLPEVNFGLMPGNGGVIRLMWLLGIEKAFDILTGGRIWTPGDALRAGLADALAHDEHELISLAKQWLLQTKEARRPWDDAQATIPGGTAKDPCTARIISQLAARVAAKWYNHFPAPLAILNTLNEGSRVDFETATRIESRYYTSLLLSREAKNMIQALWFNQNEIDQGISRPRGFGKFRAKKVGVVGAGMMGTGIAAACLSNGMEVTLKDVSSMIAEQGKERVGQALDHYIGTGDFDKDGKEAAIKKIRTTEKAEDFSQCDLVIESVFENTNLKKKVITETEAHLDEFAFLASNTISIPITRLADKSGNPAQFVGLHFFRPVEKVPLVEIVRGKNTSEETVAKAFDFVKSIGKTPIVVKDDWGFYVARVQNTYILEGITMLQEGISPALIENLGLQCGMPKGPLALADELSLELVLRYEKQAADHYGTRYIQHPAVNVLTKMLGELERPGAGKKAGFYDYPENGKIIWEGLGEYFPANGNHLPTHEIMERYLFAQVLEAIWCLQEGVINTIPEANLGSVFGWGFPAFKGGVIQYVNDFGKENFIARSEALKLAHGQRFSIPKWLLKNDEL